MNVKYVIYILCLFVFSGCATIINGKTQTIDVTSKPAGAVVEVDGLPAGITPLKVIVPRNKDHTLHIFKEGYYFNTTKLKRSLSGVAVFYLLPGGLVSFGVDATQGSLFTFQNSVAVYLHPFFDPRVAMALEIAILKAIVQKGIPVSGSKEKSEKKPKT
jgi:PEGA domain-containing protein